MPSVSNEINKLIKTTYYNVINQTVEISYMDDTKITIPVDSIADFNASNPSQMIDLTNYIYTPYSEITVEIDHDRTMHNRNSDGTLSFIFGMVKGIRKIDEKTVCLPNGKLMPLSDLYHCLKIKAHHNIDYGHGYASFHKGEVLPYQILGFDSDGMEIKVQTYKYINRQKCSIKRTDIIINDESFLMAEIDRNENNIKSLPSKKQDYLPQLSFNRGDKYALVLQGEEDFQNIERTYAVIGKIDKLNNIEIDAVIVKQIGGDNTTIFSLTKADCKELGIKYVPGLQLFPANMDWKQLETNHKEYSTDGEKKQDKNDLQKALYELYSHDFFVFTGGDASDIYTTNSEITTTCYDDLTIDSVVIKVNGFNTYSYSDDTIIDPYGHIIDVNDFLSTLKILTKNDIIEYDDCASFKANGALPFRVVSVKQIGKHMTICDDDENYIKIEIDLQKPCRIQGQTPTGYIGISIDNNLPKDNFVVAWLFSKDNSNNEEEDIEPYWQFTQSKDFYEEYLPYFDKNKYFNLKKKYVNT